MDLTQREVQMLLTRLLDDPSEMLRCGYLDARSHLVVLRVFAEQYGPAPPLVDRARVSGSSLALRVSLDDDSLPIPRWHARASTG